MPMFTPLPGYDPARMGALLPPPPVNIQLETPHFEMPKLALGPTEDRVRAALLKEVGAHCCWGDKAAKEAKITKIMPSSAFNYDLQSWTEGRQTDWTFEPFRGQMIDGPEHGPAPGPWDISVIPPPPHTYAVLSDRLLICLFDFCVVSHSRWSFLTCVLFDAVAMR